MEQFIIQNPWIVWLIILWILPWKGIALILNTLAVLEILYIFVFSRKPKINQ